MPVLLDHIRRGNIVRIRGERWRVSRLTHQGEVAIAEVAGFDATNRGTTTRFLLPFEPTELLPATCTPRVVRPARWRHVARTMLADATPSWCALRVAARAAMTVAPFQLEPALAITSGRASRLLVADDVGLGKTVQAGLVVAELLAREPEAHIAIVCPAGLQEQWAGELRDRFGLSPVILNAAGLARLSAGYAAHDNPWSTHPLVITSIDYVKRAEVMRSLEALVWDAVVFDEAHRLSGASDRTAAASLLATRARRVLLLTATPHSGDDEAFRRLCDIGRLEGEAPLLVFRRDRAGVGLDNRRHGFTLAVRPTSAESQMHVAMMHYARRVWSSNVDSGTRLAVAVLLRRAYSSAASLARSVDRRLGILASVSSTGAQPSLPFADIGGDDEEPSSLLAFPGLSDADEERRLLERVLDLAHLASHHESKIAALARLLRRVRQPALVFTEYRDTLAQLVAQLPGRTVEIHGGQTPTERRGAAREFSTGGADLLLATDAASEGLNLHWRCRLVISLELPWTPTRLEQRIGRVDRIGQQRTVHAVNLVARGSGEESVLSRLLARTSRARATLDGLGAEAVVPAPLVGDAIVRRSQVPHPGPSHGTSSFAEPAGLDLGSAATTEASRILTARRLGATETCPVAARAVISLVRRRRRGVSERYWLWKVTFVDGSGRWLWDGTLSLRAQGTRVAATAVSARAALDPGAAGLTEAANTEIHARLAALADDMRPSVELLSGRERALIGALERQGARLGAALVQPGLFDHRAGRAAAAQVALLSRARDSCRERLRTLDAARNPHADERALVFAVALQ
jgi:superfamily II DNA or RNA helicase